MPSVLGGRYRLDTKLGAGGMGEVWRAHDPVLDRAVAIKIIRSHLADDPTVRERLRIEAQLAGSLHHPGIVDVFDYGEHEDGDKTIPFFVMPLIDGAPLSDLLSSRKSLTVGETMAIIADVAEALQVAHAAGIVHRDLKPGNILLTGSGRVMLVDFGIARASDGSPLTQTGTLLGTADYLSPEQAAGRAATGSSDLYALGVVAYTCLTGLPPFHRDADVATALAHIQDPIPALPDHVARECAVLVETMLAKDPSARPDSAADVADVARGFGTSVPALSEIGQSGVPPTAISAIPLANSSGTLAMAPTAVQAQRPTSRLLLLGSLALALAVAIAAFVATRGPDTVTVPDIRGESTAEAIALLEQAGLTSTKRQVNVAGHKAGDVVAQVPVAGSRVTKHSAVQVNVASGNVSIPGDELVGSTYAAAAAKLKKLGLVPQRADMRSNEPAGTVIAVDPSTLAANGIAVTLTVAQATVTSGSGSSGSGTSSESGPPETDAGKGNKKGKGKKD